MKALVIGSSGGIGAALVERLHADPGFETIATLSRSEHGFDIGDEKSIADAAQAFRVEHGAFDLIINAAGALVIDGKSPEKTIKTLDADGMMAQFRVNAVGPALLLKHFHHLLPRQTRGVFASLSARVGSIGDNRLGGWISYRAAKAAQNQIVRTAAIEIARTHPEAIVLTLHPGTVATRLSQPYSKGHETFTPDFAAASLLKVIANLQPSQTGGFFSYSGQSIDW
ncbi:SDR family NAD(P)-dependent oxidoreductase [Pararhizobium arenae]|uniref:SDR family NAD(P)-dependent oxidoreductase n=1 Tax=Pararhizobium arenae TaxID=1856850 RepID=UPI000A521F7A|nr:SDR family NAD(P)-dependent oxidoreductase [Pararhizobium arenae]